MKYVLVREFRESLTGYEYINMETSNGIDIYSYSSPLYATHFDSIEEAERSMSTISYTTNMLCEPLEKHIKLFENPNYKLLHHRLLNKEYNIIKENPSKEDIISWFFNVYRSSNQNVSHQVHDYYNNKLHEMFTCINVMYIYQDYSEVYINEIFDIESLKNELLLPLKYGRCIISIMNHQGNIEAITVEDCKIGNISQGDYSRGNLERCIEKLRNRRESFE